MSQVAVGAISALAGLLAIAFRGRLVERARRRGQTSGPELRPMAWILLGLLLVAGGAAGIAAGLA